jgi:hypothetical protein
LLNSTVSTRDEVNRERDKSKPLKTSHQHSLQLCFGLHRNMLATITPHTAVPRELHVDANEFEPLSVYPIRDEVFGNSIRDSFLGTVAPITNEFFGFVAALKLTRKTIRDGYITPLFHLVQLFSDCFSDINR